MPKNDMRVLHFLHWHVIPRKLPGVRPMSAAHEICGEPNKTFHGMLFSVSSCVLLLGVSMQY